MSNILRIAAIVKAVDTIQRVEDIEKNDLSERPIVAFADLITQFVPIILQYNNDVRTYLIQHLLEDIVKQETDQSLSFNIDNLVFAKATEGVTFPPIGDPFLDEFNNLHLYWDTPINLLHQDGYKDELSFIIYNVTKNLLEHKGFNDVIEETTVDFTFIGLNDDWEKDELFVWAIWSRYDLNDLTKAIANSEQLPLCTIK